MNRSACVASMFFVFGVGAPTMATAQSTSITIISPTVTLTPTATDYANDYVEATGAAGIQVNVKNNSNIGMVLMVRCSGVPQIALSDFLIRTLTSPGPGGVSITTYTPITAVDQQLWRTATRFNGPERVVTDVRIRNLINYDDAAGGARTNYTNTLTFTIISL